MTDEYMRQRKLKNLDSKYEVYEDLLVYEPKSMVGRWGKLSLDRPVYVEIGCGKGKFIAELAEREPEHFFVAIEGNKSVMLRAMEKIRAKKLENVRFIPELAGDLSEWFSDGEVMGIYLNFSDPLPKNYWYKRRLTYRDRLVSYFRVLEEDGTITFKTDNTGLFEWSVLEIQAADLKILDITRDLQADPEHNEKNIETEYEAKYSGLGEKIKQVVIGRSTHSGAASEEKEMGEGVKTIAAYNGREIPKEDKVFATVGRAADAEERKGGENTINATAGVLLDDEGKLVMLDSVAQAVKSLSDEDYSAYAPISGTAEFREAVCRAALGGYEPRSFVKAVACPGGTGAVRLAVENYSCPGDRILTHSPHWAPYKSIATELGRGIETFDTFDEDGRFNIGEFEYKVKKLTRNQEHLVIILNTPAQNPTGYSLTDDDWQGVKRVMDDIPLDKKVALLVDAAYIDYAGEPEEVRGFIRTLYNLRANILPLIAYSASKTFTIYGFRCAALICMAYSPEVADEFESVTSFAARTAWSNSPRPAMTTVAKIMNDEGLLQRTEQERAKYRDMLIKRGRAFEKAAEDAGLEILPYKAGFFVTIPFENPDRICAALEKKDVFLISIDGGARVSIASISEDKCRKLPYIIKDTMDNL